MPRINKSYPIKVKNSLHRRRSYSSISISNTACNAILHGMLRTAKYLWLSEFTRSNIVTLHLFFLFEVSVVNARGAFVLRFTCYLPFDTSTLISPRKWTRSSGGSDFLETESAIGWRKAGYERFAKYKYVENMITILDTIPLNINQFREYSSHYFVTAVRLAVTYGTVEITESRVGSNEESLRKL